MPTPEASEWEEPTAVLVARGVLGSAQDAARTTFTIENAQAVHDAWDAYDAAVRAALVAEMQAEPSVPSGEAVACVKRLAYWANLWAEQGSDETLTRDIVDGDERVALASLATLREERDALLADKARLDWLEKFAETGAGLYAESNSDSFDWDSRKDGALRQALDATRAAHQGTEP